MTEAADAAATEPATHGEDAEASSASEPSTLPTEPGNMSTASTMNRKKPAPSPARGKPAPKPKAKAVPKPTKAKAKAVTTKAAPEGRAILTKRDADDLADHLCMVGNCVRIQILDILDAGPEIVGSIADRLAMSQPAVSHHLALLRARKLIRPERDGKTNIYSLTKAGSELAKVLRITLKMFAVA